MPEQRAKRSRPDIVGADQPQSVDALGVGEAGVLVDSVHAGSSGERRMDQPERVGKGAGLPVKLKRRTFTAIFFLACIVAPELEQVVLEKIGAEAI
jgi:hypothetical protein